VYGDTTCLIIFMRLVFRSIELFTMNLYASKIVGFHLFLILSGTRCIIRMVRLHIKYRALLQYLYSKYIEWSTNEIWPSADEGYLVIWVQLLLTRDLFSSRRRKKRRNPNRSSQSRLADLIYAALICIN
jgi:hypothetical protein